MSGRAEGALSESAAIAEEVWHQAWQSERAVLLGFLRRQVRDRDTAEDLLQETFVRAIRAGRVEAGASVRSYLFAIATNLIADHWRRQFRVVSRNVRPAAPGETEPLETLPDGQESPEARAGRRGIERHVREALALLPDSYRSAFELAALEQRSYREVAVKMGWSLDQVRINVHRARKRLIAELGSQLVAEMRGA